MQEGASNGVLMPLPPAAYEDNVLDWEEAGGKIHEFESCPSQK